jgi:hypothetical protein
MKPVWAGALAFALLSSGCGTTTAQKLNSLTLGMPQGQVKRVLGNNYIAKASKIDADGSKLELWEYTDKETREVYRVYFKDGLLAQWGTQGKLDFPELNLPK